MKGAPVSNILATHWPIPSTTRPTWADRTEMSPESWQGAGDSDPVHLKAIHDQDGIELSVSQWDAERPIVHLIGETESFEDPDVVAQLGLALISAAATLRAAIAEHELDEAVRRVTS